MAFVAGRSARLKSEWALTPDAPGSLVLEPELEDRMEGTDLQPLESDAPGRLVKAPEMVDLSEGAGSLPVESETDRLKVSLA